MTYTKVQLWLIAAVVVVVAGAAIRIAGGLGGLWFDEIWSLNLIHQRAPTPLHVFWSVQHDNVHGLYGLYSALLPAHPSPLLYRLPAIIFGTGTILVAGLIGWRDGKAQSLIAMVLVAFSYPLVQYGSEARGYAPMIFFVLLAFWLTDQDIKSPDSRRAIWIAVACGAAVLSHLSAIFAVLALVLWAALNHITETKSLLAAASVSVKQLFPTLIVIALVSSLWIAAFLANGFEFGALGNADGFEDQFVSGVGNLVKLMFGLPILGPTTALAGAAILTLALIVWQFAHSDPRAAFNTLILFGVVGGLFCAELPGPAAGRYYLFALIFLMPLAAQGLGKLFSVRGAQRTFGALLLCIFIAGNSWANGKFLIYGRGSTESVLSIISQKSSHKSVRVAVDHHFRLNLLLTYHAQRLELGTDILTVPFKKTRGRPPNWLILHDVPNSSSKSPSPRISVGTGFYELQVVSPHWGLSGFTLYLYRYINNRNSYAPNSS